jgi:hypothetical protein
MSVQMTASEIELAKLHADLAVKEARFQLEKARLQVEEAHYAFVLAQQSLFSKQIELNVITTVPMIPIQSTVQVDVVEKSVATTQDVIPTTPVEVEETIVSSTISTISTSEVESTLVTSLSNVYQDTDASANTEISVSASAATNASSNPNPRKKKVKAIIKLNSSVTKDSKESTDSNPTVVVSASASYAKVTATNVEEDQTVQLSEETSKVDNDFIEVTQKIHSSTERFKCCNESSYHNHCPNCYEVFFLKTQDMSTEYTQTGKTKYNSINCQKCKMPVAKARLCNTPNCSYIAYLKEGYNGNVPYHCNTCIKKYNSS